MEVAERGVITVILYTPMQLELVLSGLDQMSRAGERTATVGGVPVLVQRRADGSEKIVQLLSTNPADFLRQDLNPGALVKTD